MSEKKSPEVFRKEVFDVWGDSVVLLTPYTRCADKVLVRFKECGHECLKNPNKLLAGHGCTYKGCRYKKLSMVKVRDDEWFKQKLRENGYDYEVLSPYKGTQYNVTVRNMRCGHVYSANAGNIIQGSGCPVCHGFKDTEKFKEIISEKYPGEYTILGEYVNKNTRIKVMHKCGFEWDVLPGDLLRMFRCPKCNKSRGETIIKDFLEKNNYNFKREYSYKDCIDKAPLRFDFAIFLNNKTLLVEFDGQHHYEETVYFKPSVPKHDAIKDEYCKSHNIPLLRIPYWEIDNIDVILTSFIKENM